jgi:hypothetical protein
MLTVFLWNVPFIQYDDFMEAAGRCIRHDGAVVIGVHDAPYLNPVVSAILRNFNSYYIVKCPGQWNSVYYVCMQPKAPGI